MRLAGLALLAVSLAAGCLGFTVVAIAGSAVAFGILARGVERLLHILSEACRVGARVSLALGVSFASVALLLLPLSANLPLTAPAFGWALALVALYYYLVFKEFKLHRRLQRLAEKLGVPWLVGAAPTYSCSIRAGYRTVAMSRAVEGGQPQVVLLEGLSGRKAALLDALGSLLLEGPHPATPTLPPAQQAWPDQREQLLKVFEAHADALRPDELQALRVDEAALHSFLAHHLTGAPASGQVSPRELVELKVYYVAKDVPLEAATADFARHEG